MPSANPTGAPATQPAKDFNAGPSDIAAPKLGRTGQPDAGFMRLHQTFLDRGKSGPIGLLFLGDSITQYWTRAKAVYDAHYSKYQPANFGISGDKTQHVLWRIENGELDNIHPKLVVLLIGTNNFRDSEDQIWRGDKKIVDEIHQKLPDSKLLILGIFPRGNDHDPNNPDPLLDSRYPDGPHVKAGRAMLAAVNAQFATLDDGKNTRYLDVSDKFLDANGSLGKDMMADYLHPTPKGYAIWADAMQPLIDQMMGGPTTAPSTN
jgi:beta-glucosidase